MGRYFNQMDIDSGDELEHYGVKGMKWGVRRYQNYDGTRIKYYGDNEAGRREWKFVKNPQKDFGIKKGFKLERLTADKNESSHIKPGDSKYVSRDHSNYIDFLYNSDYVKKYETTRDVKIAGRETIDKILQQVGGQKLQADVNTDFMMDRSNETTKDFIAQLRKEGYSGMMDPEDSGIVRGDAYVTKSAMIIVDDILKETGSASLEELYM